ncbi:MAG: hypothetical protein CVT63_07195, partial [Candidatus Anoxymicrobium japonicum]
MKTNAWQRIIATATALIIVVTSLSIVVAPVAQAAECGSCYFTWQNPLPHGSILYAHINRSAVSVRGVGQFGYACSTSDGGSTWTDESTGVSTHLRDIWTLNSSTDLACGEQGTILKCVNGVWSKLTSLTAANLYGIGGTSSIIFAVGAGGVIQRSVDSGTTWAPDPQSQTITTNDLLAITTYQTNAWAVGNNGTIIRFNGEVWSTQTSGTTNNLHAVSARDASNVLAAGEKGTNPQWATAVVTSNKGTTWTATTATNTAETINGVHYYSAAKAVACANNGITLTWSGGVWTPHTVTIGGETCTNDVYSIVSQNANSTWALGEGGLRIKSGDLGVTWTDASASITHKHIYGVSRYDQNNSFGVGDTGCIIHTSDGGVNWSLQTSGVSSDLYSVSAADASTAWAVGASGVILKTTNAGVNWDAQTSNISNMLTGVSAVNANIAWAVGYGGVIRYTTNGGTNWATQTSGISNNINGVCKVDANTAWVVADGGIILKTTDGGTNWSAQTSGTTSDLKGIYAYDSNIVWAVGAGGVILKTINGGTNWSAQASGTTSKLNSISGGPISTVAWAVGDTGTILRTSDGGATWRTVYVETTNNLRSISVAGSYCHVVGEWAAILDWHFVPAVLSTRNPTSGQIGAVVSLTGTGFHSTAGNVTFGGVVATTTSWSDTAIDVVVPNGISGIVDIVVASTCAVSNSLTFTVMDPRITSVLPISGAQGQTMNVAIVGTDTSFANGVSVASFGAGITVNSTTVTDATHATANITIAAGAAVGTRDVNVVTGGETPDPLLAGFTVRDAKIASVLPISGAQGQTMNVAIVGTDTSFANGVSVANFGAGITVNSTTVTD